MLNGCFEPAMAGSQQTYTHCPGKKVSLEKQPEQFVVRALPEELQKMRHHRWRASVVRIVPCVAAHDAFGADMRRARDTLRQLIC
jgi:hypothetical protein